MGLLTDGRGGSRVLQSDVFFSRFKRDNICGRAGLVALAFYSPKGRKAATGASFGTECVRLNGLEGKPPHTVHPFRLWGYKQENKCQGCIS